MMLNINSIVRVQLTDKGRTLLKADFERFLAENPSMRLQYEPPEEDVNGWSQFQMWQLMSKFGSHFTDGADLCFNTVIEIPKEALYE